MTDAPVLPDNLRIWERYAATDPRHTKPVSFGRKFTAIDTYYQIMRATEAFGPWGEGWGWTSDHEVVVAVNDMEGVSKTSTFAKVALTLWYIESGGSNKVASCGPVIAMNLLVSNKGVPDEEAFKKATTDALTKSLSYLGFSADVFMGKFDDNRYVEAMKAEFIKADAKKASTLPAEVDKLLGAAKLCADLDGLLKVWDRLQPHFPSLKPAQLAFVQLQFSMLKGQVAPGAD